MFRRVIREPLVHFLVAGALIFAVYTAVERDGVESPQDMILIGDAEMLLLRGQFEKLWGRAPGDQELAPLVREFIREEVLYREGLALGLERDDLIVRRRIAQKMEFLIGDLAVPEEPDDETLANYLEANRDSYLEPPRLSFTHVYFSVDRRGENARADAETALADIGDLERAPEIGDSFALSVDYAGKTEREVDQTFGSTFAKKLLDAPVGEWFGPIGSAYGLHLVRVHERTGPRTPPFDELRDRLVADYAFQVRRAANARALARLSERYRIVYQGDRDASRAESLN
jgi:hypothetical protein